MGDMTTTRRGGRILGIVGKTAAYLVMGTFALMTTFPIVWLVLNSFKTTQEYLVNSIGLPREWTTVNYPEAWRIGDFGNLVWNSLFYTVGASIGILLFSCLAGFAFAKIKSKATPLVYGSFIIGILLSIQSLMVPLFIEVSNLDKILGGLFQALHVVKNAQDFHFFYNTRVSVLLIYIGAGLPIAIYLATEYIKGIPDALVEAARLDGASYWRIFMGIIVPMSVPIATTVSILNITGIWNEFALINILVSSTSLKSLPLGIYRFASGLSTDYGKQFSALVIGMAPMLAFYVAFRKQITKGVSAGAIKG
jgi:raffinose/stachyose/melibiose transport system permease protein